VTLIYSIAQAKATVNEVAVAAQQSMYNQPCTLSQIQEREADIRALGDLSRALDKKASATRLVPYFHPSLSLPLSLPPALSLSLSLFHYNKFQLLVDISKY
jgi:hypothetical protein